MGALYSIAYQPQQTPAHFTLVAAMAGHPWTLRERMVVADLGCGRGHVAQVLAAANPGWTVFGLDQDPAAIAEARLLAARAGLANANFLELDLAALDGAELDRLPECDVVMAHGVWGWVPDAARAGILRFLARRLKPGGLFYIGTSALPAAGEEAGLQRLLRHLAEGEASEAAAAHAMARLRALEAAGGLPLPRTPMLERLLADPPVLEPGFVAHEFLTPHWRPVFHDDLAAELAPARLEFLGSCNLADSLPSLAGTAAQRAALGPLAGTEFARDLLLARPFRADVFVRGRRRLDPAPLLDALPLAAWQAPPATSPALRTAEGRATLPDAAWAPIAALLAEGPARLGALRAAVPEAHRPHPAELLALLVDTGLCLPVFRPPATAAAATRLNREAAAFHAPDGGQPDGAGRGHFALASPVAAGGVPAGALDLALVGALLGGGEAHAPEALLARLDPGLGGGARLAALARLRARLDEALPAWLRFGILPPAVAGD